MLLNLVDLFKNSHVLFIPWINFHMLGGKNEK
jgi:hypothetical protein